ncbi:hypothetical protein AVEN_104899-1 [Araneus ventricosus]|uniref:Uncharacterized protein n=1 Tax=Araneus ventricosus TaxID=182803 RepID=A0A4Y2FDQ0_ARAVE|nr:hypothetical protein AVEN_104899-1 [Araneus ventricosus]
MCTGLVHIESGEGKTSSRWCGAHNATSTYSPIGPRIHKDGQGAAGVVQKFGERVPDQVFSSLFDQSSKLRGPFQNSPRVA